VDEIWKQKDFCGLYKNDLSFDISLLIVLHNNPSAVFAYCIEMSSGFIPKIFSQGHSPQIQYLKAECSFRIFIKNSLFFDFLAFEHFSSKFFFFLIIYSNEVFLLNKNIYTIYKYDAVLIYSPKISLKHLTSSFRKWESAIYILFRVSSNVVLNLTFSAKTQRRRSIGKDSKIINKTVSTFPSWKSW